MRFKAGDLARVAIRRDGGSSYICEIIEIGPYESGHIHSNGWRTPRGGDYRVRSTEDGSFGTYLDWQLQPVNPPAEPKSLTRSKENQGV